MRILRFIITVLLIGVACTATAQTGCGPVATPWSESFDSYGTSLSGDPCPMGNYVWVLHYSAVTRPGATMEASGSVLHLR